MEEWMIWELDPGWLTGINKKENLRECLALTGKGEEPAIRDPEK